MIAEIDLQNRAPLVIGATGMDAGLQNIRIIIMTFAARYRWTAFSPTRLVRWIRRRRWPRRA